ncbi:MAG: hypothetical protein WBL68_17185 [Nitrososphaeraceae archaeon]
MKPDSLIAGHDMEGLLYFRNHTKLGSPNSVEPQQYDEIEIDLTRVLVPLETVKARQIKTSHSLAF